MIDKYNWQEHMVALPAAKRWFDIFFSTILLIVFSPFVILMLIIYGVEKILVPSSRGPVLYKEIRVSGGKPFLLYKFRIFKVAAIAKYLEQHGFVQTKALESDKRNLTYTGRVLKQIYMDEMPQLICVLKGDMTLVGPRPSNEIVSREDLETNRFQRWIFTCGITGPLQTNKGNKTKPGEGYIDRDIEYINYVKNNPGWKIVLKDLVILFQTVLVVVRARGI